MTFRHLMVNLNPFLTIKLFLKHSYLYLNCVCAAPECVCSTFTVFYGDSTSGGVTVMFSQYHPQFNLTLLDFMASSTHGYMDM